MRVFDGKTNKKTSAVNQMLSVVMISLMHLLQTNQKVQT